MGVCMSRRRCLETLENSIYVTIGELARITGVRYSTLKFYTEEGILPFYQEDTGLTRRYIKAEAIARITEIKELRNQGLTIQQIKDYYISKD